MKRLRELAGWGVPAILILTAGCGDSFAPEACAEIEDIGTHIGEKQVVPICFEDADGDELMISASSSNEDVVKVISERGNLTIEGVRSGEATVTVTATDPSGEMASLAFGVRVINRQPESKPFPSLKLTQDAMTAEVLLTEYFSDPDGQALSFDAVVNDSRIVTATVNDSLLLIEGHRAGEASIRVTATDPEGLSAVGQVDVMIEVREQLVRDDFDSELAGEWEVTDYAIVEIEDGRLETGTSDPRRYGLILREVDPAENWTISARIENATNDLWTSLWIETGDSKISRMLFIFGGDLKRLVTDGSEVPQTNFTMALFYEELSTWRTTLHWNGMFEQIPNAGEPMDVTVSMEVNSIKILVNGEQAHEVVAIDHDAKPMPATIRGIGLLGYIALDQESSDDLRVYYDWIEISGIRSTADMLVPSRPHLIPPVLRINR